MRLRVLRQFGYIAGRPLWSQRSMVIMSEAIQVNQGNELADALAGYASKGTALTDFQFFLEFVHQKNFTYDANWFWMLFRSDVTWQEGSIQLPARPTTLPSTDCFPLLDRPVAVPQNFRVESEVRICQCTDAERIETHQDPRRIVV